MRVEIKRMGRKCRHCGGQVVEIITKETEQLVEPPLMATQLKQVKHTTTSEGIHCKECGTEYRFTPLGQMKRKKKTTFL